MAVVLKQNVFQHFFVQKNVLASKLWLGEIEKISPFELKTVQNFRSEKRIFLITKVY